MNIYRMIFECVTPLHCGTAPDAIQDEPVIRDAFGCWRIPGSSIAGALRSLGEKIDKSMTGQIFGNNEGEEPKASLIWCDDALLLDFDGKTALAKNLMDKPVEIPLGPYVRDHVKLSLETGSAENAAKFDCEIVPPGTRFFMEIRCDGWDKPLTDEQEDYFGRLCALAEAGRLDLGGKTANGYGHYKKLESQYRKICLWTAKGKDTWLNLSKNEMFRPEEGEALPLPSLPLQPGTQGLAGSITMPLVFTGPVLIGGGSGLHPDDTRSDADMAFAFTPIADYSIKKMILRPVIPASSIKGVFRHAIYQILMDMGADKEKAEKLLKGMFGFTEGSGKGQCGKIGMEDCNLKPDSQPLYMQHVAIDRFTGGALDGALFSEEPLWAENMGITMHMDIKDASAAEAALIIQAVLDLGQGLLAVGGGVNRGNGRLQTPNARTPADIIGTLTGTLCWQGQPLLAGTQEDRLNIIAGLAETWQQALCKEAKIQ